MNDSRCYSRSFMLEFINLYKSLECLWKVKSASYSDKDLKAEAYQKLVDHMRKVDPEADKELVSRKINNLRSGYKKELAKIIRSGNIYTPKLWYFNHLSFLYNQEKTNPLADEYEENTESSSQVRYDITYYFNNI